PTSGRPDERPDERARRPPSRDDERAHERERLHERSRGRAIPPRARDDPVEAVRDPPPERRPPPAPPARPCDPGGADVSDHDRWERRRLAARGDRGADRADGAESERGGPPLRGRGQRRLPRIPRGGERDGAAGWG